MAVESLKRPQLTVVLQPTMFFSAFDPPDIVELPLVLAPRSRVAVSWNGLLLNAVKGLTHLTYGGKIQQIRQELGLARQGNPIFTHDLAAVATIGLYSPLMGRAQLDFPARGSIAGFALYDGANASSPPLDTELATFLSERDPPIVFTLGSLAVHGATGLFEQAVSVALRLGKRALLLATQELRERLGSHPAPGVIVRDYVPHSLIFPHAAAVVHHGGMGTIGQALRAGTPQLAVPFLADGPDNAARLVRLGVARALAPNAFGARAALELEALLGDKRYATAAAQVRAVVARENGADAVAEVAQTLLERKV